MKPILLATQLLLLASMLYGQDTITSAQAAAYLGKEVVLVGKFTGRKYHQKDPNNIMYFINVDANYPNNEVAIVLLHAQVEQCGLDRLHALPKDVLMYVPGVIAPRPYTFDDVKYLGYQIVVKDCKQIGL